MKLRVLDLFSGIGGFSLGLERTGGFETVAFCEIDPFCRAVLAKHWPNVRQYEDVRKLTADTLAGDGIAVDVITGGFPCQDISVAGKRAGISDGTRSGLWSEIVRLAGELRPKYIIVENVANLLSGPSEKRGGWFGRVLGDLAECGYDAEWENIPASAVGAPHRRERVWLLARNANQNHVGPLGSLSAQCQADARRVSQVLANANSSRLSIIDGTGDGGQAGAGILSRRELERAYAESGAEQWSVEPDVGRVADGVPARAHRLAALGNAVVPQIPEMIGRAILAAEGYPS